MSKEDDRQIVSMRSSHCDMKQLALKLKWIKLWITSGKLRTFENEAT